MNARLNARHTLLLAVALLAVACTGERVSPTANEPKTVPAAPRRALAANDPCTVHWASGVAGAWTDPTKWTPAGVPGAASSVCIDAPGTYNVTLDPTVDATPVAVLGIDVGGAGSTPTLRLEGAAVTMNVTQGIVVRSGATMEFRTTGASVVTASGLENLGTFAAVGLCGGCGAGNTLRADIDNRGTFSATTPLLLPRVNGVYVNTGTIVASNVAITIPAAAGNPTFAHNGGVITGLTGDAARLSMLAGVFTMNGGKTRARNASINNLRPVVLLDGASLVIAPGAADSASLGVLARSTTTPTVTGDIPALTTLWLGGSVDGQAGRIDLVGNPTNRGTLMLVRLLEGTSGQLTVGGNGRLTNEGVIDQSNNSGAQAVFTWAMEVTNNATMRTVGSSTMLARPAGNYINNAIIDDGVPSNPAAITVLGSTLRNAAAASLTGGNLRVDGGRFVGGGTISTNVVTLNGGVIEPGQSPGIMTVTAYRPQATGTLRVELGGAIVGTEYDQLATTGFAFAGTLDIVEINGFQSGRCGQVFDVLTHRSGSSTGAPSAMTVNGLNPGPGRMLRVVHANVAAPGVSTVRLVGYDGAQKVCVGPNPIDVREGGPGMQYAIALDHAPTTNVVVSATANAQVTVSPASLTFTASNWQMPQFFTVTAVDDAASEGTHTGTVTHAVVSTDATYQGVVPAALTANITDNDQNLPPIAGNDAATTAEDTPVVISVLANDSDPEGLSLGVSAVSGAAHGTTAIVGSTVRYTPAADYFGQDTFTYTVSDGSRTSIASVTITITPLQDAPTARNDQSTTVSGSAVAVSVLANDVDVDGESLTITQTTAPAHGTATIGGGGQSVTYTPVAAYVGNDVFTYSISDGHGGTATATVTVSVTSANRAPVAAADAAQMTTSTGSVRVLVLANDSDPDGDVIRLVSVSTPANGTVRITGRSIVYTIGNRAAASDQFSYTITDRSGAVASASVSISWPSPFPDLIATRLQVTGRFGLNTYVHFTTQAPAGTTITTELVLPTGARFDQSPYFCQMISANRYRCTVQSVAYPDGDRAITYAYIRMDQMAAWSLTARVIQPNDPDQSNNSLTTTFPSNCTQVQYFAYFQCTVAR